TDGLAGFTRADIAGNQFSLARFEGVNEGRHLPQHVLGGGAGNAALLQRRVQKCRVALQLAQRERVLGVVNHRLQQVGE
ncbi:MAG: hypothetical protein HW418_4066, partial [Anaerolineales bacterium]|nr:hypothetical protein [Anaerolineales bacterium]